MGGAKLGAGQRVWYLSEMPPSDAFGSTSGSGPIDADAPPSLASPPCAASGARRGRLVAVGVGLLLVCGVLRAPWGSLSSRRNNPGRAESTAKSHASLPTVWAEQSAAAASAVSQAAQPSAYGLRRVANRAAVAPPSQPSGGEPATATTPSTGGSDPPPKPAPAAGLDPPTADRGFLGQPERALLEQLRSEPLNAARKGSGGRTLAFKVTLASGIKGYFKPEQSVSSAHWYAEVAAYHLDRALGLGRVPPVTSRKLPWNVLLKAAASDRRVAEVTVGRDGRVRGALISWLNEPLLPAVTPAGWENWVRAAPFSRLAVSPYQRAEVVGARLARVHQRLVQRLPPESFYETAPPATQPELPAALSDMIVFDFLTLNYDRFGGDNANVLTLGAGGPLIFLDNGDGFSAGPPRRNLLDERLAPLSRFRKRTIDALRAFDIEAFARRLAREPLGPILDTQALDGLAARRAIVLEHVAAQQRRYGDVIYAW